MKWKIGDKVRLTGREWGTDKKDNNHVGAELRVTGVDDWGHVRLGEDRYHWGIYEGWEIELVEREEETMTVDFSGVNVGDKVRLTRENGDESTFTVKNKCRGFISSDSQNFSTKLWDTLEIVERAFKPVPGLYSNPRTGDRAVVQRNLEAYYAAAGGRWVQANVSSGNVDSAVREEHGWKREITF